MPALKSRPDETFRIGRWIVDTRANELRDGGCVVRTQPRVMDLLISLTEHAGQVCGRQELLDAVWHDSIVSHASLTVAMSELREVLGDDPKAPEFVETIPRRGYRWLMPVVTMSPESIRSRRGLASRERTFVLWEGENLMGRDPEARVHVASARVSRHHARISIRRDSASIEDLGSKNGTYVNDEMIHGPLQLELGDSIELGRFGARFRFVALDDAETLSDPSR